MITSSKWNGKPWSEDEISLLKENYLCKNEQELLLLFPGRTIGSIRQKALKIGLKKDGKRPGAKYWTPEEENRIEKYIAYKSVSEIANIFDVPYAKMVDKIHKMGLNAKKARNEIWSLQEDNFLKKHFVYAPRDYICQHIDRTWSSIKQHGGSKALGLQRIARDITSVNYRFFDNWSEDVAYWLGFIMADGYLSMREGDTYLQIEQKSRDVDIIYKLAASLKLLGRIYISPSKDSVKLLCSNWWLCNQLVSKGIPSKNKSSAATYPQGMPQQYDKAFIRGLIDGDGWCSYNDNQRYKTFFIGVCGTLELLTEVKNRIPFDLNNISITISNKAKTCYHLNIQGKKGFDIAAWLYEDATIFLDRKKQNYEQAKQKYLAAPSHGKPCEDRT